MVTVTCDVPGCRSFVTLHPLDKPRADAALKERGWAVCDTPTGKNHYCQVHKDLAEQKAPESDASVPATG